jgi:hypothetical protein
MKTQGFIVFLVGVILCVPALGIWGVRTYDSIKFWQNCGDYLKLAADANSINIAKERLNKALDYIEKNNLTKGNSSVFFTYPENDLEIWYTNLKETQRNLTNFPEHPTEADTSTALVKLRETLLDHGEHGDRVTRPNNIHIFPYNVLLFWGSLVSLIFGIIGGFLCVLGFCMFFDVEVE